MSEKIFELEFNCNTVEWHNRGYSYMVIMENQIFMSYKMHPKEIKGFVSQAW